MPRMTLELVLHAMRNKAHQLEGFAAAQTDSGVQLWLLDHVTNMRELLNAIDPTKEQPDAEDR